MANGIVKHTVQDNTCSPQHAIHHSQPFVDIIYFVPVHNIIDYRQSMIISMPLSRPPDIPRAEYIACALEYWHFR